MWWRSSVQHLCAACLEQTPRRKPHAGLPDVSVHLNQRWRPFGLRSLSFIEAFWLISSAALSYYSHIILLSVVFDLIPFFYCVQYSFFKVWLFCLMFYQLSGLVRVFTTGRSGCNPQPCHTKGLTTAIQCLPAWCLYVASTFGLWVSPSDIQHSFYVLKQV